MNTYAAPTVLIQIETDLGPITVELYLARAPRTVAAFLEQVDRGAYIKGCFWRIVRADNDRGSPVIEVIQARCAGAVELVTEVPLETTEQTGLSHEDGTLSLPRSSGHDATAQGFFLCVGNQPALNMGGRRIADGLGFAAFGRVVQGLEVARAIHAIPTLDTAPNEYLSGQIAADPVTILAIRRLGTVDRR